MPSRQSPARHDIAPSNSLVWSTLLFLAALLIALFATIGASQPSRAATVITEDHGGYVQGYRAHYSGIRESGERVIIDGDCLSACTLVLAMVPPDRVCVTRRAIFGFHAVRYRYLSGDVITASGTDRLVRSYPPKLQNWIARNGGLRDDLILLTGSELLRMYPQYGVCRAA